MLRTVPERLPILLDLEVPFWDPSRLRGPRRCPQTARAIDSLVATAGHHHEVRMPSGRRGVDWPGWLQLRQPTIPPAATRSTAS